MIRCLLHETGHMVTLEKDSSPSLPRGLAIVKSNVKCCAVAARHCYIIAKPCALSASWVKQSGLSHQEEKEEGQLETQTTVQ